MESKLRNEITREIEVFQDMGGSKFLGLYKKYEDYSDNIFFVILTKDPDGIYGHTFEWDPYDNEWCLDELGAWDPQFPFDPDKENYEEVDLAEFFML